MHTTLILAHPDDESLAKRIYADLLAAGVRPWLAIYDLAPGQDPTEIQTAALRTSEVVIVLLSKRLLRDQETIALAGQALSDGKTVLPVLADLGVNTPAGWPEGIRLKRRYGEAIQELIYRSPKTGDPIAEVPAWQQGNEAYALEDFEGAEELYKTLKSPDALALHSRAAAYNALRKHAEALADLDLAIAEDGNHALYYRNRSVAHAGLGELEKALADDHKAIELAPQDPRNWSSSAITLTALERFEEAESAILKALEIRPESNIYLYQHGLIRAKAGDHTGALEILEKALAQNPDNEQAQIWRRIIWGRMGRYDEALADVDKLIKRQPKRGGNYVTRSLINFYMERYTEAVKDASAALERSAEHQLAGFYNRAIAQWKLGEKEKAQQDMLSAIQLLPVLKTEAGIRSNAESDLTSQPGLEILAALKEVGAV